MVARREDQSLPEDELIEKWIEPNPFRPGPARARLREYGVSVWALIGYLQGLDGDPIRVAEEFDIPPEAVHAALAYYRRHQAAIDSRIAANAF